MMKTMPSIAQLQRENITLELESIDRMYLNASVPKLTNENEVASLLPLLSGASLCLDQSRRGQERAFCAGDQAVGCPGRKQAGAFRIHCNSVTTVSSTNPPKSNVARTSGRLFERRSLFAD
jgi:hypothetical protein